MKTRITYGVLVGVGMIALLALMIGKAWANWDPPPPNPDSDGDGLLDAWEIQYFGDLTQGPNDDPDGDGVSNLEEFQLGRNPTVGAVADTSGATKLMVFTPLR